MNIETKFDLGEVVYYGTITRGGKVTPNKRRIACIEVRTTPRGTEINYQFECDDGGGTCGNESESLMFRTVEEWLSFQQERIMKQATDEIKKLSKGDVK